MAQKAWEKMVKKDLPLSEQNLTLEVLLNPDYSKIEWPDFSSEKSLATRDSNGKILNAIAKALPNFIGGSADLSPSNKTELNGFGKFPNGRNIYFGIKEHSMAAIVNAMNLYGLFRVYSSTFFVFSDYLKPAARIAALSNIPHHFIWTHDSIGVGEDGPTHQPIEHLSQFRALPNFYVYRPADASENIECWKSALTLNAPSGFVLSRQKLDVLKPHKAYGEVSNGGYLLTKRENAHITILASGSEVMLALKAGCHLEEQGINANIVSVPCFDLLCEQSKEYIDTIIDPNTKVFSLEASRSMEWYKFADVVIGMDGFGASGKDSDLFKHFGFTIDQVLDKIKQSL